LTHASGSVRASDPISLRSDCIQIIAALDSKGEMLRSILLADILASCAAYIVLLI
jgi:hypothetical protein